MTAGWRDRTLGGLLRSHGLDLVPEHAFPNDGWSGATFTSLTAPDGRRCILKRTSLARDWIARATDDTRLREAWLATLVGEASIGTPFAYLGAAADGDGAAILMPDLSTELIAWERPGHDPVIDGATLATVVDAIARLHRTPWPAALAPVPSLDDEAVDMPWCPLDERLTLLTRPSAVGYAADGNAVGSRFLAGWDAFDRRASMAARSLVDDLANDVTPLAVALDRLPRTILHGDLKLANVAILPGDLVAFIDWQMVLRAPVAVDLGWFLVSNTAALPVPPDRVLEAYRRAPIWGLDVPAADAAPDGFDAIVGDWDAQMDLAMIVGLLLRGWRKGLDAEADATLASGVSAVDDLAWWCDRAVEAATRRL